MTGFFVHRDSRTEVLAAALFTAMDSERPAHVLAPQTVVVAHPGLGRWLLGEFARRGSRGIAANFDLIQPWQWLERTAGRVLGGESDSAFRKENLRWHIHAMLPALDDARVRRLLDGEDGERRRFQLADHLAGVYTQYLTYRPDWIAAWESGVTAHDWQGLLWQRLRRRISGSHRAQRHAELVQKLTAGGDGMSEPLHIFGVSHLPADILAALRAVSVHRPVHLYFPDPCREYWADLKSKRELLRKGDIDDEWHFEIGHPLLISLGRMAQDFFIALEGAGIELDAGDGEEVEAPADLRARLQTSIRSGDPERIDADSSSCSDASLRVHSCTTRLRELEVLRDALLRMLADDADLRHRDIVVMAPDIAAYAPYLPAVFGEAAHYRNDPSHIPWHLADVRLTQTHPLLRAFANLLDLAESRFALSEVLDLLDVQAVARRFGLDSNDREALEDTLRHAGVAWGLDAAMKAHAGGAAVDENSWAFGFDRIFTGAIAGGDTGGQLLDGVLPLPGIDASAALVLGRVHRLLDALHEMRDGFAQPRRLPDWCDWLGARVDALFRVDADDLAEGRALDALRCALTDLVAQGAVAGTQKLPWSVVRETVRGQLDGVSERQPFLLGGVTFCGLVPQRSIPFKAVCLIGMNAGEFPRAGGDAGLNRMLDEPRRGDRETRREDRQLFLEALMAARAHLHISYLGRDASDGRRIDPAAPLAELLQFLDERHGIHGDAERPWLIEHPLQPFDARYFDESDARLFTFDGAFARHDSARPAAEAFVDFAGGTQGSFDATDMWTIDRLARFWRDPLRAQLRDAAGIDRAALDDDMALDEEPLDASFDRREAMEKRMVLEALRRGWATLPDSAPPDLARAGRIAVGAIGAAAWADVRSLAQPLLDAVRKALGAEARQQPCAVDVDLGDVRLTGNVREVYACAQGRALVGVRPRREADFGDLIPFYIRYAALRLSGCDIAAVFMEVEKEDRERTPPLLEAIIEQDTVQLRVGLRTLLDLARQAPFVPVPFPPKTAWAWCAADPGSRAANAKQVWQGNDFQKNGECEYAPGYGALFLRGVEFLDGASPAARVFAQSCEQVAGVLDPGYTILLKGLAGARR